MCFHLLGVGPGRPTSSGASTGPPMQPVPCAAAHLPAPSTSIPTVFLCCSWSSGRSQRGGWRRTHTGNPEYKTLNRHWRPLGSQNQHGGPAGAPPLRVLLVVVVGGRRPASSVHGAGVPWQAWPPRIAAAPCGPDPSPELKRPICLRRSQPLACRRSLLTSFCSHVCLHSTHVFSMRVFFQFVCRCH